MVKITHELTHDALHITGNQTNLESNCHAIMFDNVGEVDAEIFINNSSGQSKIFLPAGGHITLGNNAEFIVKDKFNVQFTATGVRRMNIVKQIIQRLEH
jgi:hypothetical protein